MLSIFTGGAIYLLYIIKFNGFVDLLYIMWLCNEISQNSNIYIEVHKHIHTVRVENI
jgi:hypothetical protein